MSSLSCAARSLRAKLRTLLASRMLQRAFVVAIVVGSILNLINQGDALFHGGLNWPKAILTYLVPFAVSTHGALSARKAAS
jgi:hypothetical protein